MIKEKKINLLFTIIMFLLFVINFITRFNYLLIVLSIIIFMLVLLFNKFKIYNFFINIFYITVIVLLVLSLVLNSFNCSGILLFYIFLLIISLSIMIRTKYSFEIVLPITSTLLIFLFIILGFVGLLHYSIYIIICISLICFYYLIKNRQYLCKTINSISMFSYAIFSIFFLIAIFGGLGRYVHKWDEYSYWGYSAKVLIDTGSFSKLLSYVGTMNTYPPVSSIWHYIFSIFAGSSEQYLYMGLTLLDFIFLIPIFIKIERKKILIGVLLGFASFGFPILLNGSISYSLLYVDLLMGLICASILIIEDYLKRNKRSTKVIYLFLILISLLKPNGFVLSSCLLLLFYLKDLMRDKVSIKLIFTKMKKYIFPVFIILILYASWSFIATHFYGSDNSYMFKLIPKALSTDISLKLNFNFILSYINSLISSFDETIIYSFIPISLFTLLIFVFIMLYRVNLKEEKYGIIKCLLPYVLFYIIYFILTALSLFVMFTYYEASILASFSRYLNPVHIALVLFVFYKISYIFDKNVFSKIIYMIFIILIGFGNITYFVSDLKIRRDEMYLSYERKDKFNIINERTPENSKIFIINQTDEESIMPIWYARYYCYPRVVNANPGAITWKIRTASNEWDLKKWGLNKKTFAEHIIKYNFDYVFFYSVNDELINELSDYFENNIFEEGSRLYKVKLNKDGLILNSVKE